MEPPHRPSAPPPPEPHRLHDPDYYSDVRAAPLTRPLYRLAKRLPILWPVFWILFFPLIILEALVDALRNMAALIKEDMEQN